MARANHITHNGGRLHGAKGKLPARRRQLSVAAIERMNRWGITPLDVLIAVMVLDLGPIEEGKSGFTKSQFDAAVAAAPYVHPKLAAIAYTPPPDPEAEKRRNILAQLTYQERKELQAILERARTRAGVQIETSLDGEVVVTGAKQCNVHLARMGVAAKPPLAPLPPSGDPDGDC
jgi:hypothetical protein